MGLGGVISNLLSLGAQLIPVLATSKEAPSSSSSTPSAESHEMVNELKNLMELLERIKATLYDAEEREIMDRSVKLWLRELRAVAYDAEDVLDEFHYEVLRSQVEARDASPLDSRKRKLAQVPDGMLDQIQQIRSRFSEITKDRISLQLSEEDGPRHCHSELQIAPTSHFVVESNIIGREKEKEQLISILCTESRENENISVVTIVGTGGIGKTTLAKLVYNEQKIQQKFDKFGWVCVSEDFNLQRLTREMVESITRRPCDLANLSALQEHMSEEIRGKMLFLVLDDVWNENRSHWELFQIPFKSASSVKILVTTRNEHVAQILQTVPTFNLGYMSAEKSWQLFQHYAFGEVVQNTNSKFIEIGKQILRKCGMLPLAVKSIASLLRHEKEEEGWKEILGSQLWESIANNDIFRPLQISYARLPTYLKPCFLYCSMFPRNYRFDAKKLVKLWIYQGYVQPHGLKNAKEIGAEYVKQLFQRSLFEEKYGGKYDQFTLHDMVHDLARSISGHGCYSIEGNMFQNIPQDLCQDTDAILLKGTCSKNIPQDLCHLYIHVPEKLVEPPPSLSSKFATLRTLMVMDYPYDGQSVKPPTSPSKKFATLRTLMAMDHPYDDQWVKPSTSPSKQFAKTFFSSFNFSEARKLRALQFAPDANLESHFSFVNLKHLRYLYLGGGCFERLPDCMCSFYNLQDLTLQDCACLTELPESIANLVSLEELTLIKCKDLRMLPLSFCQLKALRTLCFSECSNLEMLPPDMGNLVSLEKLTIDGCVHLEVLPMSLCQLKVLRELCLQNCPKFIELPQNIGNLVSLEKLTIFECKELRVLPISFCQLKALRKLHLYGYNKLKELPPNMENVVSLVELTIQICGHLRQELAVSLYQLKALRKLKLYRCPGLEELPLDMSNFVSLEKLTIFRCKNLRALPLSFCQLKALRKLYILGCPKLKYPPDMGELLGSLKCLDRLIINQG